MFIKIIIICFPKINFLLRHENPMFNACWKPKLIHFCDHFFIHQIYSIIHIHYFMGYLRIDFETKSNEWLSNLRRNINKRHNSRFQICDFSHLKIVWFNLFHCRPNLIKFKCALWPYIVVTQLVAGISVWM